MSKSKTSKTLDTTLTPNIAPNIDDISATSTNSNPETDSSEESKSRLQEFAKTSRAAKLSGVFHQTTGKIKRKIGEFRDDNELRDQGKNQELLGKVHRIVGNLRAIREDAIATVNTKRKETQAICIKHGGRILDVAGDFVEELKKTLLS